MNEQKKINETMILGIKSICVIAVLVVDLIFIGLKLDDIWNIKWVYVFMVNWIFYAIGLVYYVIMFYFLSKTKHKKIQINEERIYYHAPFGNLSDIRIAQIELVIEFFIFVSLFLFQLLTSLIESQSISTITWWESLIPLTITVFVFLLWKIGRFTTYQSNLHGNIDDENIRHETSIIKNIHKSTNEQYSFDEQTQYYDKNIDMQDIEFENKLGNNDDIDESRETSKFINYSKQNTSLYCSIWSFCCCNPLFSWSISFREIKNQGESIVHVCKIILYGAIFSFLLLVIFKIDHIINKSPWSMIFIPLWIIDFIVIFLFLFYTYFLAKSYNTLKSYPSSENQIVNAETTDEMQKNVMFNLREFTIYFLLLVSMVPTQILIAIKLDDDSAIKWIITFLPSIISLSALFLYIVFVMSEYTKKSNVQ
jgi:hypothetical protein